MGTTLACQRPTDDEGPASSKTKALRGKQLVEAAVYDSPDEIVTVNCQWESVMYPVLVSNECCGGELKQAFLQKAQIAWVPPNAIQIFFAGDEVCDAQQLKDVYICDQARLDVLSVPWTWNLVLDATTTSGEIIQDKWNITNGNISGKGTQTGETNVWTRVIDEGQVVWATGDIHYTVRFYKDTHRTKFVYSYSGRWLDSNRFHVTYKAYDVATGTFSLARPMIMTVKSHVNSVKV